MGPFPGPTFSRLEAEQPVNAVGSSARDPLSRASGPFGNEAGSLRGKSLQADVRTSPSAWPRSLPCAFVCVCSLGPDSQRAGSVLGGPADAREPTSGFPSGSRRACLPRAFRGASSDSGRMVRVRASWATARGQQRAGTKEDPAAALPAQPAPASGTLAGWGAPRWRPSVLRVPDGRAVALPSRSPSWALPQTVSSRGSLGSSLGSEPAKIRYIFFQRITSVHKVSSVFNFLMNIYFSMNGSYTKANSRKYKEERRKVTRSRFVTTEARHTGCSESEVVSCGQAAEGGRGPSRAGGSPLLNFPSLLAVQFKGGSRGREISLLSLPKKHKKTKKQRFLSRKIVPWGDILSVTVTPHRFLVRNSSADTFAYSISYRKDMQGRLISEQ